MKFAAAFRRRTLRNASGNKWSHGVWLPLQTTPSAPNPKTPPSSAAKCRGRSSLCAAVSTKEKSFLLAISCTGKTLLTRQPTDIWPTWSAGASTCFLEVLQGLKEATQAQVRSTILRLRQLKATVHFFESTYHCRWPKKHIM